MNAYGITKTQPASAERMDRSGIYLVSSIELRAGLEVSALSASVLPPEVQSELLRLQSTWSSSAMTEPGQRST